MVEKDEARDVTVYVQGFEVNLSPDAFHFYATHYYQCKQDFKAPDTFSPVPYFLVCRAIELEINKSKTLEASEPDRSKKGLQP